MHESVAAVQACVYCDTGPGPCSCELWCGHADCDADAAAYDGPDGPAALYGRPVVDVPVLEGLL